MLWLLLTSALAGPCDLKSVPEPSAVFAELPEHSRASFAAAWLAEACVLPSALDEALATYSGSFPEQQPLIAARAVAADPVLLVAACVEGPGAIAEAMRGDRTAARATLFDRCGLGRFELVDRGTFVDASGGDPLLFLLAAQAIGAQRTDPWLRVVLRALAGARLPTDPLAPIVPRLMPVGP